MMQRGINSNWACTMVMSTEGSWDVGADAADAVTVAVAVTVTEDGQRRAANGIQ